MQELNHPNMNDKPQGTAVSWSKENTEQIEVLVWTGYAPSTGEYVGTRAIYSVNEGSKTLTLERVYVRYPKVPWNEIVAGVTDINSYVSDRMKRSARAFIAKEKGTSYWRVRDHL